MKDLSSISKGPKLLPINKQSVLAGGKVRPKLAGFAKVLAGGRVVKLDNTKTFDETDEMFKKFKFKKKIVLVPSNSLYVAFTNGFHKRSQFKAKTERSMVFLQYVENFNKIDYLIS